MGSALFTSVTGLLANQRKLDVISSNISNVNTTAYKGSRVLFQDLFSQTLEGARAPVGNFGGSNALQVGLGTRISSIDVDFEQGTMNTTGVASDLAIEGAGFFVLSEGETLRFSRDGSFKLNTNGELIDPGTGFYVQGYMADERGEIDVTAAPENLVIPVGAESIVAATQEARMVGNLNSDSEIGREVNRSIRVYDSLGTDREVGLTFTKRTTQEYDGVEYNAWEWEATFTNQDEPPVTHTVGEGVLLFNESGELAFDGEMDNGDFVPRPEGETNIEITGAQLGDLQSFPVDPFEFALDFARMTELSSSSDVSLSRQDGFPRGTLEDFSIGRDGIIEGVFSNGLTQEIGQVAVANFSNVGGLERDGQNMFRDTSASGTPQIGLPNTGGRGTVSGGVLEGSNVDLGTQFSELIITQRAFQANSRVITVSDGLSQETVNLIR